MIKKIIRRLVLGKKADRAVYIEYLREKGVQIGEDVNFFSPPNTIVDMTCPWLISIGNHVQIGHGVILVTHDYSWAVMKQLPDSAGEILGAQSPIKIGNHVFIGMNAIITRGVTIGDYVVIGAGSVVTRDCESNSVYAGNPAKKIMTIEQFREKRRQKQFQEARVLANIYRDRFRKNPPMEVFVEYFSLFCTAEQADSVPEFRRQMEMVGNCDICVSYMQSHPPMFNGYEAFLEACYTETQEC